MAQTNPKLGELVFLVFALGMTLGPAWLQYRAAFRASYEAGVLLAALLALLGVVTLLVGAASMAVLWDGLSGTWIEWVWLPIGVHLLVAARCLTRWVETLWRYRLGRAQCHECGYDLTGTITARRRQCPECGQPVTSEQFMWFRARHPDAGLRGFWSERPSSGTDTQDEDDSSRQRDDRP